MASYSGSKGSNNEEPEDQDPLSNWKGPRKVTLQRWANGFGFTLRHFIVYPPESAVAELNRLNESDGPKKSRIAALEPMDTIFVKQVKPDGPAHQAGLANGDRIVSVNGESVTGKTYQQVVNLIQLCDTNLTLFVVPREEDILQVAYPASAYKSVTQTSRSSEKKSATSHQSRKESLDRKNSGSLANMSTTSDDHDVLVVGKTAGIDEVESDDTELVKGRSHSFRTEVLREAFRDIDSNERKKWISSSTSNSESERDSEKEKRLPAESRQQRTVQRVKASTISHKSSAPMKVTLVNPTTVASAESLLAQKEQKTFRLTNVLNSQTSSRQTGNSNSSSSVSNLASEVAEKEDVDRDEAESQPQKHVASLKSYYDAAKLASITTAASTNDSNDTKKSTISTDSNKFDSKKKPAISNKKSVISHKKSDDSNEKSESDVWNKMPSNSESGSHKSKKSEKSNHESNKSESSTHTHSVSVDNLLSQSGIPPAQAVLRIHSQKETSSVSCDDILGSGMRSGVGRYNRQVSIINGESVYRTGSGDGSVEMWQNNQESVKVSRSDGVNNARITIRVNDTEVQEAFQQCEEYTSQATRVTVSASVSETNLASSAKNIHVRNAESTTSETSPKHEPRGRSITLSHDLARSTTSVSSAPLPRTQTMAAGRPVNLSNLQVLPNKPRDKRESTPSGGSNHSQSETHLTVTDAFFPWRRTGSRRGSAGSEGSEGRSGSVSSTTSLKGKKPPPVPKRDSSRGRVRERSLERDKIRERTMHERHRSRSYDRHHQRANWSQFQFLRKNSGQVPEGMQMDDNSLMVPERKDSTTSSNSAGSTGTEKDAKTTTGGGPVSKQRLVRRTSYLKATGSDGEEDGDTRSTVSSQEGDRPSREKVTPKRNASIRKLKSFFGEGTPRIVEAQQTRRPSMIEMLGTGPVAKEGPMNVKLSTSRSWKPVWVVLKGEVNKLFLMREQRDLSQSVSLLEQPISLNGSTVDIAYEYTKKKKNVIRLISSVGVQYLLQVSETETMLAWIKVLQENNNPPEEKEKNILQLLEKGEAPPQTHAGKLPSPSSYRKKFFRAQNKQRLTAKEEMLAKAKASESFADRMKRHIRGRGRPGYTHAIDDGMRGNATFGVPLDQCTPSQSNEMVPMVLEICCSIVEAKGLDITGIYRVPGNTGGISYLKEELRKGFDEIDLNDERWQDVNVISSLLKLFFRKLPNPLVPTAQYKAFIAANRLDEPSERMWALRRQIHNLPDHHYETFKYLVNHLKLVAANCDVNKMEVRNLAIVFGPTLVRSGDDSMVTMVTDMSDQCKIVESLIQHCDWFFSDDVESQQDVPSDALRDNDKKKRTRKNTEDSSMSSLSKDGDDEDDDDGEEGDSTGMDRTGPLKTSSMEDLKMELGTNLFSNRDLILSINTAAQRKLKSSTHRSNSVKMDTSEVKYRRQSPEPQLHTIKLQEQEILKFTIDQPTMAIDLGSNSSEILTSTTTTTTNGVGRRGSGKVTTRRISQSSLDSKSSGTSEESGGSGDVDGLPQGSLFGSTNRSYHPRSYYQNFHFGSTRGRKMPDATENSGHVNLEQELKSLTNATAKQETWVQSDYSKEKERIERQHEEALKDLEKEDDTNVEELFKSRDYLSELTKVSHKIMDYTRKGVEPPPASCRQSLEKVLKSEHAKALLVGDHSKSANNNNGFLSKKNTEEKKETKNNGKRESGRGASLDRLSKRDSPLHIDEIDLESDFVQSMKATFEDRLQKVLYPESEDDLSRPGSLVSDKEHSANGDEPRRVYYRSQSVDRTEALRQRLDSPKRDPTSGSSSVSNAPKEGTKTVGRSKSGGSPSHSPKKSSRIELIVTMEKRETTPATLRDNIANTSQEVSKSRTKPSKDTASIREKNREKRRRRHTVGGGKDISEVEKAINDHLMSKINETQQQKVSAMDRLKPFGKENAKSRDIRSWLESERQRSSGSSPNLIQAVQASIARLHPSETDKQKKEKELRRKSTPILGSSDFNDTRRHSRMHRYFAIESYL